jgi:hypothetical protein
VIHGVASWAFLGFFLLGLLAVAYRLSIDDYYVVDGKNRTIWLHRRNLNQARLVEVAKFHQCTRLRYACRGSFFEEREHWSVVLDVGVRSIPLTDPKAKGMLMGISQTRPPDELVKIAQRVGTILEMTVEEPRQLVARRQSMP